MSRLLTLDRFPKQIKAGSQITQHPNFRLFQDGLRYLKELPPIEYARFLQTTLRPIADRCKVSVPEVRTAVEFVIAVKAIVETVGDAV